MAKLELIDKVGAMNMVVYGKNDKAYFGTPSKDWEVIDFLKVAPAVTEEEIVKPYLDELKKRISKSCYKAIITDDGIIRESKVEEIIDNLLEEIGGKNRE